MPETHSLETRAPAKPRAKPHSFTLNAIFLLITACAVAANMIRSGIVSKGNFTLNDEEFLAPVIFFAFVGAITGIVIGARRQPREVNIVLGILAGAISGGAAGVCFAFPPTPAAVILGCLILVGTAAVMRTAR